MAASAFRRRLFRAIHAEAARRGLKHEDLRDICRMSYGATSLADVATEDLYRLYHGWTGKSLRSRLRHPVRGQAQEITDMQMVSTEELTALEQEFAKRSWGAGTIRDFTRRQLHGRDEIRTHGDWRRVFNGIRAMNRRDRARQQEERDVRVQA